LARSRLQRVMAEVRQVPSRWLPSRRPSGSYHMLSRLEIQSTTNSTATFGGRHTNRGQRLLPATGKATPTTETRRNSLREELSSSPCLCGGFSFERVHRLG
jgi:hypothetical protein